MIIKEEKGGNGEVGKRGKIKFRKNFYSLSSPFLTQIFTENISIDSHK